MSRIFISHNSQDALEAAALKHWLAANGWTDVFLDLDAADGLSPGERWKEALTKAVDRCEAVLCLVSPTWLASAECKLEYRYAENLGKRLFLAIIKPCPQEELPPDWQWCPLYGDGTQTMVGLQFQEQPAECRFLANGLERLKVGLKKAGIGAEQFDWPPPSDPDRAPYRGLKPLEAQDAAVFFGRDAQILHGMETLRDMRRTGVDRLLVILGASGSGKSSFMRAGLMPRLARDDGEFFPLPVIRPRNAVMFGPEGLASALAAAYAALGHKLDLGTIEKQLQEGPAAFELLLAQVEQALLERNPPDVTAGSVPAPPPSLVFPVDQAEELFNPDGAGEAETFLKLLSGLMAETEVTGHSNGGGNAKGRSVIMLTIRSDRYERLQTHPQMSGIKPRLFDLKPFPSSQFERVINGPAECATRAGHALRIEPRLTERLLADFSEGADTLPLLGFALEKLYYKFGADGDLTVEDYEAIRGAHDTVQAAIFQEAIDSALAEPTRQPAIPAERADQLEGLRRAFIPRLVQINRDSSEPMRLMAKLTEFPVDLRPFVERLVEARLLTRDRDAIEVAHESLLRQWQTLRDWITDEQANLRLRANLQYAAQEWQKQGQINDLLRSGGWLDDAEQLLARSEYAVGTDSDERAYLNACRQAQQAQQEQRIRQAEQIAEEQKKAADAQRKSAERTRIGLAIAVVCAALASAAGWWAVVQKGNAEQASNASEAQRLAAEASLLKDHNPRLAGLLAAEAIKVTHPAAPVPAAEQALRDALARITGSALEGHENAITSIAFDPQGRWLVTASDDPNPRLWDLRTSSPWDHPNKLTGHKEAVKVVAISRRGRWLVTGSEDGAVRLWNMEAADPTRELWKLEGHKGAIRAAAFDHSLHWLATGSDDQRVCLWDLYSPDLWRKPRPILPCRQPFAGHQAPVDALAFDRESRWLVSASSKNGTARLWNLPPKDPARDSWTLGDPSDPIRTVAIERQGRWLATGTESGAVNVWDLRPAERSRTPRSLTGHRAAITALAFGPRGSSLATGSEDRTVRIWRLGEADGDGNPEILDDHDGKITAIAFGRSRNFLATATDAGMIRLWDLKRTDMGDRSRALDVQEYTAKDGQKAAIKALSFGSRGRWLAAGRSDGTARLWDLEALNGTQTARILSGHKSALTALAFDPTGRWIVTASGDKTARVWDLEADPLRPPYVLKGHTDAIAAVAFDPRGRWLVTASEEQTARLWDLEPPDPAQSSRLLSGHAGMITAVAFDPRRRWLVTASEDQTARLWDLEAVDPTKNSRILNGHEDEVSAIAIDPRGHWLITGSEDQTARLWNLDVSDPSLSSHLLSGHQGSINAVAFDPQARWVVTASADGTARLWDLGAKSPGQTSHILRGHENAIDTVAFDPSGHWLATGSEDQTARLCDLSDVDTEIPCRVLHGHERPITAVAFDPGGRWLITGSSDKVARLWDLQADNPAQRPLVLAGHQGAITAVAFDPDQRWVATASTDNLARLWDLTLDRLFDRSRLAIGRNMTMKEWQQYLPHRPYCPTFPELPVPGDAVVTRNCPRSPLKTALRVGQRQTAWP